MSHLRRLELFSVVYPALPGWAKCVPRLGRLSEADGNRAGREASGTKGEGDVEKRTMSRSAPSMCNLRRAAAWGTGRNACATEKQLTVQCRIEQYKRDRYYEHGTETICLLAEALSFDRRPPAVGRPWRLYCFSRGSC